MGIACMAVLHFLKVAKQKWTDPESSDNKTKKIFRKVAWFICTARNAVVIILITAVSYGLDPNATNDPLTLTGELQDRF